MFTGREAHASRAVRGDFHASGFCCTGRRVRSGLVRQHRELGERARATGGDRAAFCRNREIRAEGRAVAAPAGRQWCAFAVCCSGSSPRTSPARIASCRAACPACCPPAPIASPTRRMTRALPPSPSRSAPTSSRATARRSRTARGSRFRHGVDGADVSRIAEGVALARDLINTPANDMGPAELEQAARDLAAKHGATRPEHRRR